MAGDFDDLIPGNKKKPKGGGEFEDLIPAAPVAPTPDQERRERLKRLARAALDFGGNKPGAEDLFGNAYTLSLQKPVGALTGALGGEVREWFGGEPATFGERYGAGTSAYDERMAEARKNAGWAGTGAELAGGVLSGAPARNFVQQAATSLPRLVGQSATLGGIEGAAQGSEDIGSAIKGGLGGAAAAGATAGTVGAALKAPGLTARRAAAREAARGTPPAELKAQSQALYKQLDNAGVAYDNRQSIDLVDNALQDIFDKGYDPEGVHSTLKGVVNRLEGLRGQPVSLDTLQRLREQIASNAGANEPQVRRIAGRLLSSIDGFVSNVDPPVSQIPGSQIAPMWQEARKLWRTANTAADIGWRVDKAGRRAASTASGTNVENPIRQNIRSVLDKAEQPGRFNPYKPEELAQMERVVEGTPTRNLLRSIGNRFGGSGPLATSADIGLGSVGGLGSLVLGHEPSTALLTGAVLGGGLYGTGKLARSTADRMAENEADALVRLISTGSLAKPALQQAAGPPTRETLARLLRPQVLGRGAGLYAAGRM